MDYISNTPKDIEEMLKVIGAGGIDDLFTDIPSSVGLNRDISLPAPLTEIEAGELLTEIAGKNCVLKSFIGAGAYNHYIPAVVDHLASRSEFYTAYTPYQPEVSQGTLTAIFEFQTLICRLTGMDITNASMYDGATSLAEAVFMAVRSNNRNAVVVSDAVHPHYRQVLDAYAGVSGIEVRTLKSKEGVTDIESLEALMDDTVSAVVVQNPNFFGCLEDLGNIADAAHNHKSYLITVVTEPMSLGILKSPGAQGADIVCGEGQSLGNPAGFGGPLLGILAAKDSFLRKMPGRLVGKTTDADGKEAYVLTLQTREQHIRRDRATSNICTNQGLCALRSVLYMTLLGNTLRDLADLNHRLASYLKQRLTEKGFTPVFTRPFFNEFVLAFNDAERVRAALRNDCYQLGVPLGDYYPEHKNSLLLCATEMNSPDDIDRLVQAIERAV
ncbi:MAG TPA: aminomethyl-transferring glycine dehydrogenase subunit GcvPA [Spirochaetota bacterium]|nr:aminomethyl-transferring glycine dehydrogenase subunit GcvPA [Spirochaetota bacterium]